MIKVWVGQVAFSQPEWPQERPPPPSLGWVEAPACPLESRSHVLILLNISPCATARAAQDAFSLKMTASLHWKVGGSWPLLIGQRVGLHGLENHRWAWLFDHSRQGHSAGGE